MLTKSLEFRRLNGTKVKVIDIPMLPKDHPKHFLVQTRLQASLTSLYNENSDSIEWSFKEYVKRRMKWQDYSAIYEIGVLKNNA